jgi:hypothetical protein
VSSSDTGVPVRSHVVASVEGLGVFTGVDGWFRGDDEHGCCLAERADIVAAWSNHVAVVHLDASARADQVYPAARLPGRVQGVADGRGLAVRRLDDDFSAIALEEGGLAEGEAHVGGGEACEEEAEAGAAVVCGGVLAVSGEDRHEEVQEAVVAFWLGLVAPVELGGAAFDGDGAGVGAGSVHAQS